MKQRFLLWLAAASLLVSSATAATRPRYGGTLRIESRESLRSLDPADLAATSLGRNVARLLYETLSDENGRDNPALVAASTESTTGSSADPGIVRNRLKIAATIQNAKAFLAVRQEFGSFDRYIWGFVGGKPKQNRRRGMRDVPASTPESDAMSEDLKKRGFKFVGSTICYAYMQGVGMIDDHLKRCFRHAELSRRR